MTDKNFQIKNGLTVNTAFIVDPTGIINATVNTSFGNSTVNVFIDVVNGRLGVNTATPLVAVDVTNKTTAIGFPVGNTGQRPAAANGYVRYNSEIGSLEGVSNNAWSNVGGGGAAVTGDIYFTTNTNPGASWLQVDQQNQILLRSAYSNLFNVYGSTFVPGALSNNKLNVYGGGVSVTLGQQVSSWSYNGYFITGKSNGTILVSNNFLDWTTVLVTNSTIAVNDIIFANGIYVAAANGGGIYYSTNLLANSWTRTQVHTDANCVVTQIAYGNGVFCAVGYTGASPNTVGVTGNVWSSTDGKAWLGASLVGNGGFTSVVYSTGGYFFLASNSALGNSTVGGLYRSAVGPDTSIWTHVIGPNSTTVFSVYATGAGVNGQVIFAVENDATGGNTLQLWSTNGTANVTKISNICSGVYVGQGRVPYKHILYMPGNSTFVTALQGNTQDGILAYVGNNGFTANSTWNFMASWVPTGGGYISGDLAYDSSNSLFFYVGGAASSPFSVLGVDFNSFYLLPSALNSNPITPVPLNGNLVYFATCNTANTTTTTTDLILSAQSNSGLAGSYGLGGYFKLTTNVSANAGAGFCDAAYGNGRYCVLAANLVGTSNNYAQVYYSPDLASWTQAALPGSGAVGAARLIGNNLSLQAYNRIAYANNKFIASCAWESNTTEQSNSAAILSGNGSSFAFTRFAGAEFIVGLAVSTPNSVVYWLGNTTSLANTTLPAFGIIPITSNIAYSTDGGATVTIVALPFKLNYWGPNTYSSVAGFINNNYVFMTTDRAYSINVAITSDLVNFKTPIGQNMGLNSWYGNNLPYSYFGAMVTVGNTIIMPAATAVGGRTELLITKDGINWTEVQRGSNINPPIGLRNFSFANSAWFYDSTNRPVDNTPPQTATYSYNVATQFIVTRVARPNDSVYAWMKT